MILIKSSILVVTGLIKPNNVFVNELFWGAKFDLSTYQIVFVVLELHMVETIITSTVIVKGLT